MILTSTTEVTTSEKKMITRSTMKLFKLSFSRLKANMQSTRARLRKIRLSRIVMDKIRMSRPSSCYEIGDRMLIE